ncbi:hypothetical protein N8E89_26055 (plasmid) [Phyllobacterium sp. A18/5-2]|uniref:hypothetical protein n=1 Tax=Phyllobacterium sp. A18/5-2 TaxID=2978392 RepID=UPI0021C85A11|nr:hypothetical protein [Phyllobacterium sp. A18/5-2]UXN66555.1 hypothetical protein N8E89_26055 [Phyllobacterium sp. A18/5-2]
MTDKSTFTPEEWNHILGGVMLAGMAVTMADQSGLWGMLKESMASTGAVLNTRNEPDSNGLVQAVVADFQTSEGRAAAREEIKSVLAGATSSPDAQAKAVDALKKVATLLDTKASADAQAFKSWLQAIGQRTADAANEGGFLGFGGVAVSDAEKAALDQIAQALNPSVA